MKTRYKQPIKKGLSKKSKINKSKNVHVEPQNNKNQNTIFNSMNKNIWIILILILTILIYFKVINNDFVFWDDDTYIHDNPYILSLDLNNLKKIFTEPYFCNYHPFTTLTYAIEYYFFKLNPHPYHFLNFILHLINTLLVFLLIKGITKRNEVSLITALLFAIHPMHVESVAWISERKDVLYAMFFLSSLIFYVKYQNKRENIRYLIIALILFVCSLMSKSAAVTLPLVMLLVSYYINKKIIIKDWLYAIPFFALSLVFGIIALKTQKDAIGIEKIKEMYVLYQRLIIVCFAIYFYIVRFIAPYGFSALHPYPEMVNSSLPLQYYIAPFFLILLIILILISKKELRRTLLFGFLFFIITIFLVIQLIPLGYAVVSERYTYIPYIGLSFILAHIFMLILTKNNKVVLLILAIPYLIFLSFSTIKQNAIWKDSEALWTKVIDVYHDSYYAFTARGNTKAKLKDYKDAIEDYNKAISLDPKYAEVYSDRGRAYNNLKNFDAALLDYSKAIELSPKFSEAFNGRGAVLASRGRLDEALSDLNFAIKINPKFTDAYNNRGSAKVDKGDVKGAIEDYSRAISLNPGYEEAYTNRGAALTLIGKMDEALADFNKAIQINPKYYKPYENIASLYYNKGEYKESLQYFDEVVRIMPEYAHGYFNRGITKNNLHDLNGACADWNTASKLGDESAMQMIQAFCQK